MARSAVRLPQQLLEEIDRLAAKEISIADIWRRIGELAERRGLPRPSYERIRILVHEAHLRSLRPSAGEILLDVTFGARPLTATLDALAGTEPARWRR
ncbi:MAG TPA: hypothetical protein VGJ77_14820 [Gaiellaceae bacterium]